MLVVVDVIGFDARSRPRATERVCARFESGSPRECAIGRCWMTTLVVMPDADAFLRHVRLGRDGAELTTRSYAGSLALFLRWCARTGRDWHAGVEHLGLFIMWLRHASAGEGNGAGELLVGPGM